MEPTLRDISMAAGWLQDNLDERDPTASRVESLAWLIAAAREDDKRELARLKAMILCIDPESDRAAEHFRGLQRELSKPEEAEVVNEH